MKIEFAVAAALVALLAGSAQAQQVDCKNALSQNDMNFCADQDFQKADKALNAAYRKVMADMDDATKTKLKIAQRAWVTFRDAECDYESMSEAGGSMQPMIYSTCQARLTKVRTKELTTPSY